ncbi:hypothetical protein OROMI_017386 [Orobanche minor]
MESSSSTKRFTPSAFSVGLVMEMMRALLKQPTTWDVP